MQTSRCLFLMVLLSLSPALHAAGKGPNILVLLANDWRADIPGRQEDGRSVTPEIDRLTRRGVAFTHAYSPGTTVKDRGVCRRAALFSGRSPLHVKASQPDGLVTMPDFFKKLGYWTSLIGELHAADAAMETEFDKTVGFEESEEKSGQKVDEEIATAAIDEMKTHNFGRPWLMCVSFTCPTRHDEKATGDPKATRRVTVPENYAAKARADYRPDVADGQHDLSEAEVGEAWERYTERVRAVDRQIGRVLASLRQSDNNGNTLIIFTSANGTGLGSHGLLGKDSIYEETVHVPLIFSGVDLNPDINRSLVTLTDVLPTLIDFTDSELPQEMDGHSLKPLLSGSRERVRTTLFTTHRDTLRAMRDERWKLIVHLPAGGLELYDLQSDPLEMRDVSGEAAHASRVASMMVSMRQWQHAMGDLMELPRVTFAALPGAPGR